jgi:hypothetical protein
VKARQPAGDVADLGLGRRAGRHPAIARRRVGVAAHLDGVLDRRGIVLGRDPEPVPRRDDRAHAVVDVRRQARVEPHLFAAELVATVERAVVEERQAQRLLELEGQLAGEQHPGDMRFAKLDAGRPMPVGRWIQQRDERPGQPGGAHPSALRPGSSAASYYARRPRTLLQAKRRREAGTHETRG